MPHAALRRKTCSLNSPPSNCEFILWFQKKTKNTDTAHLPALTEAERIEFSFGITLDALGAGNS
jgi:hypothetical protein